MAIDFDSNPGGLFTRIGKGAYVLQIRHADIAALKTAVNNVEAQYQSTNQNLVDLIYTNRDSAINSEVGSLFYWQSLAQSTLIQMVDDDTALSSPTVNAAMPILIAQMISGSETVKANTVSVAVTTGSGNTGTAVCIASVVGPDGKNREYVFNETIVATATTDSQSGGTAGSESWSLVGEIAESNTLSQNWPLGSGVSTSLTTTDPATSRSMIANGDFEDFTVANTPDNWTITVGSAGGTVFSEGTIYYRGVKSLKILGDGSQLTALTQSFNQSSGSGSTPRLKPSTVYGVSVWIRMSATPTNGTLILELIDGGGTVISNDQSVANRITKVLSTVSTSWVNVNGFFQTPRVMPSSTPYKFRIRLSVAIDNAKSLYIDDLGQIQATELYTGGPYVAIFTGATATVKADTFSIAVSNNWGGKFQKTFERYFGMRSLGQQLPSATGGGETISDSLVG